MSLRLKIMLALLGVIASMASLGFLGLSRFFDSRQAEFDLQQLNQQRLFAHTAWLDLGQLGVLAERVHSGTPPGEREKFQTHADDLLATLAGLSNLAIESGARDRFVILRREIAALERDYDAVFARESTEGSLSALASIPARLSRIRQQESQVRSYLENRFLVRSVTTSREVQWSYFWLYSSGALAVLLAVGFGFFLYWTILGPIGDLRDAAEQIRNGELEVTLEATGNDELADVTRAFIEMSESLQAQFEEEERLIHELDETNERVERERRDFERLVDIGNAASSTLEVIQLLGVLTTRGGEMIPCIRCSMVRPDPDEPTRAMILSSTHYQRGGPTTIDLRKYPEIRAAIDRQETIHIDDVATDALMREVAQVTLKAGVSSILTVPMMHQGRLLGVASFLRDVRLMGRFTAWEHRIAEAIAGIGAVCMENADLYTSMMKSRDDVDALNRTLRETVEELRNTQDRLVSTEKLAAVGEVSASIAHSLKNPLAAIRAMAQADQESGGSAENLGDIIRMVDRMGAHMNQILDFCSTQDEVRATVDPNRTIGNVLDTLRTRAEARRVTLVPDLARDLPRLSANPERFERAVLSVVENAIEACEPGCRVEIRTKREGASGVRIEVEDEGPGISEDVMPRVFEPFFSTKTSGTGLGTTIARKVVESLSGTVQVTCAPEGGTTFLLRIPGMNG